jgi:hypothetical protein
MLRSAAAGFGAIGVAGHPEAVDMLVEVGIPSRDPTRAPISLAVATIALRNTPLMVAKLESLNGKPQLDGALTLIAEGFDMLEEDLDKERFFVLARRTFWESPEGSPRRSLMQTLIGKLDF